MHLIPATAEKYYINVYVRPVGDYVPYVVTTYITYNIQPANLTGVTLTVSPPSPQQAGTPITFTANAQGGIAFPNVEYQFYVQYKLVNGTCSANILLQDWSTSNLCTWTPTTSQKYYVNVNVRPVGDTTPYAVTNYTVDNVQ